MNISGAIDSDLNFIDFQDREKEKNLPLKEICVDDILDSQRRTQEQRQDKHRLIAKALKERGLNNTNADLAQDEY